MAISISTRKNKKNKTGTTARGITTYASQEELNTLSIAAEDSMAYSTFSQKAFQLPLVSDEWANVLDTTTRTLQRKKEKNETFNRLQTERILEIEALTKQGIRVFGSSEKYIGWLSSPAGVFKGQRPKDLLASGFGIDLLFDELGRIEHGIFS